MPRKTYRIRSIPSRYAPLSPSTVRRFLPLAAAEGVSSRARSASGFTTAYLRAGSLTKIAPQWKARRRAFLARHVTQAVANRENMFRTDGRPSRRHLALIMWGWSPFPGSL